MLSFLLYDGISALDDFQETHFLGDGAFQENLEALSEWINQLRSHSAVTCQSYLRRVLDACVTMLEEGPRNRPSARDLATLFPPGECCFFTELVPRVPCRCPLFVTSQEDAKIRDAESALLLASEFALTESQEDTMDRYCLREYFGGFDRIEILSLKLSGHLWSQSLEPDVYVDARFEWATFFSTSVTSY
jgi:hypothetical protein